MTQHYDLDWPEGFDRTPPSDRRRYPGGFEVSRRQAFDSILEELEKMDAYNIEVQTAAPHRARQPHQPYKDRDPEDPGVVVYFERDGKQFAVPCDRWNNLRDNARAIAKYLDAKRAIERYGVATVATELHTQALPAAGADAVTAAAPPHEVLGVDPDAADAVVRGAARELIKEYHGDTGSGDHEQLQRVKEARDAMLDGDANV